MTNEIKVFKIRLQEIAIMQQKQQQEQQQEQLQRRMGSVSKLPLNPDVVKDHLLSARSEVERLRVINDNVGREIAANQVSGLCKLFSFVADADAEKARVFVYDKHRDKTRVQMPAKIFPHLKVKC
jgi:hypothetical protein